MKILKEFILVVFSICMLGLAILAILMSLQLIDIRNEINNCMTYIINNRVITMSISFVVSLLALVGIFVSSDRNENVKAGLAIKHETGTIYITKDTFESIVLNVTKSYASLRNVKVVVNISEEGAYVSVFTYILPDTVVPTLTSKLQEDIKDTILKQTTVEIKEANIKIKGVFSQSEKKA